MRRPATIYTEEERAWVKANCTLVINELHRQFCERFNRQVLAQSLGTLRTNNGWKVGRNGRWQPGQKGASASNLFNEEEIAWVELNYRLRLCDLHQQFCCRFSRNITPLKLKTLRRCRGLKTGYISRRAPAENWIKLIGDGSLPYVPTGPAYISANGFWKCRIIHGSSGFREKPVHHLHWEAAHGPIPPGMVLKCKGDRLDVDPANWELIPRAVIPGLVHGRRRMKYDDAPEQLKPAIMLAARLEYAASQTRTLKRVPT